MKECTTNDVFILVFVIITGIAFLETFMPVWTLDFWREFLYKIIGYTLASVVLMLVIGSFKGNDTTNLE